MESQSKEEASTVVASNNFQEEPSSLFVRYDFQKIRSQSMIQSCLFVCL